MMNWESPRNFPSSSMKGIFPLGALRKSATLAVYGSPVMRR